MNPKSEELKQLCLIIVGAAVGAILGYWLFFELVREGLYAMVVPGGFLGVGAGLGRSRRRWVAVVTGVLALAMGIICEWRFAPFIADQSLGYFLAHLQDLQPATLIMILAGTAIGFYIPFRRSR